MQTLLEYKLDILKTEIETINSAILRKDEASRQLKTWAITLWIAATTLTGVEFLKIPSGQMNIGFHINDVTVPVTALWALATLVIPLAFLILEVYQRRIQRKFIWRARKIHEFLNDRGPCISKAFQDNDIEKFRVYDPAGENSRREIGGKESKNFDKFIGPWTVVRIPNVFVLYLSLAALSITLTIVSIVMQNIGQTFIPSVISSVDNAPT